MIIWSNKCFCDSNRKNGFVTIFITKSSLKKNYSTDMYKVKVSGENKKKSDDELLSTVSQSAESTVELKGPAQDLTLLLIKDKESKNEREIERERENKI